MTLKCPVSTGARLGDISDFRGCECARVCVCLRGCVHLCVGWGGNMGVVDSVLSWILFHRSVCVSVLAG